MTPLAHAIAKQMTLPLRKRKPVYLLDKEADASPATIVTDIHCFECSAIVDLACDLSDSGKLRDLIEDTFFLPAPKTWIEFRWGDTRHGWLLSEGKSDPMCRIILERPDKFAVREWDLTGHEDGDQDMRGMVLAMLAMINTPKIVGRQQFMPHRGLERALTRQMGVGRFPLHAWTELKLSVSKPIEIDDGEPHEAHLTGRRALHFCRAHLRIRLGQLEFVTSHWRGDPALGIKQTRYVVQR